jgi:hypothetical protein
MNHELPPWPSRLLEVVREAARVVLPHRVSVETLAPAEAEPHWEIVLRPASNAAAPLHLFVGQTQDGNDNFEAGSRSASFELWEKPDKRIERLSQIVKAVIEGQCVERVGYVGSEPVWVELTLALPIDGPTTYSASLGRPRNARRFESFRGPERFETHTFQPY